MTTNTMNKAAETIDSTTDTATICNDTTEPSDTTSNLHSTENNANDSNNNDNNHHSTTTSNSSSINSTSSTNKTYYEILDVSTKATYDEIKRSYHEMALYYHPDKRNNNNNNNNTNLQKQDKTKHLLTFEQIKEAWECLRNSDTRYKYNQQLYQNESLSLRRHKAAIVLYLDNDFQEAIDDETNELVYVYDCRCGEEVQIYNDELDNDDDWEQIVVSKTTKMNIIDASSTSSEVNQEQEQQQQLLLDCPGCCFTYRIIRN